MNVSVWLNLASHLVVSPIVHLATEYLVRPVRIAIASVKATARGWLEFLDAALGEDRSRRRGHARGLTAGTGRRERVEGKEWCLAARKYRPLRSPQPGHYAAAWRGPKPWSVNLGLRKSLGPAQNPEL